MEPLLEFQLLGKIIIGAFLGGLVGLEREFAEKPAGLRTHMLVGGTATFLVILARSMVLSFEQEDILTADPVRVMEAIIVGISFLGAGTILKSRRQGEETVEGLTTSASILTVAAIGIAVALDAYILAVGATVFNLIVNWVLAFLVHRFGPAKE
jgi:putative Mg2+ transporter-C (MgtC) family protein